ncbi:Cas10/Cmr2 second palm domain-containing protein [Reticulibacter mediterranei]
MQKSLVAFDTDHIKNYVFGTDRLKEIRGASSLLDRLNRTEMEKAATDLHINIKNIYANGGSGLFVVDKDSIKDFVQRVQQVYRKQSKGKASVTYAIQDLPEDVSDANIMTCDLEKELELLKYRLIEKKGCPNSVLALPSHPFITYCSSCGVEYAEKGSLDAQETGTFYCASCIEKQKEDIRIKNHISRIIRDLRSYRIMGAEQVAKFDLWERILWFLDQEKYDLTRSGVDRPEDFNEFRQFAEAKEYIGLIYADANNMGQIVDTLKSPEKREIFAFEVDKAIHQAMAIAIKQYLPIVDIVRNGKSEPVFPFDILLVGGDDIVMVTNAAKAMDVALTVATRFRELANNERIRKLTSIKLSLCVGVVLAPIKYPFGLLQDMAESALKFAKTAAANDKEEVKDQKERDAFDGTRINFQVVTGGSHPNFNETYKKTYQKVDKNRFLEFHASLRAYKPEDLELLLNAIREGHRLNLGRTKLHQLREAILEKNLTTSVQKGLATLRNWREKQRTYVVGQVYGFGQRRQMQRSDPRNPISDFPHVTFPWFADGTHKERNVYRTSLLDFIELYDFVTREGGNNGDEV